MQTIKIVVWEQDGIWLGYLQEYPEYWTQGENSDDLWEHLIDLQVELSGRPPDAASPDLHGEILLKRLAGLEVGQTEFVWKEIAKDRHEKR